MVCSASCTALCGTDKLFDAHDSICIFLTVLRRWPAGRNKRYQNLHYHAFYTRHRVSSSISPMAGWEGTVRRFISVETQQVTQQRFRRHHRQRLTHRAAHDGAHSRPAPGWTAHTNLHITARRKVADNTLEQRGRVLRPLPFIAVRQQHHEAAHPAHFCSPEEMNWSITTCAPLAKSPNCASQIVRVRVVSAIGITVFKSQYRYFRQHGSQTLAVP